MEFVDIPKFEGHYKINRKGEIKSVSRKCLSKDSKYRDVPEKILKLKMDKYGYLTIKLFLENKRYYFTVHRLVALTFLENPLNHPQINHKNGIKTDNTVENLEWCTNAYNIRHAIDTKLMIYKTGVDSNRGKMTKEMVLEMKRLNKEGISFKKLEKIFKMSHSSIHHAVIGKTYKELKEN